MDDGSARCAESWACVCLRVLHDAARESRLPPQVATFYYAVYHAFASFWAILHRLNSLAVRRLWPQCTHTHSCTHLMVTQSCKCGGRRWTGVHPLIFEGGRRPPTYLVRVGWTASPHRPPTFFSTCKIQTTERKTRDPFVATQRSLTSFFALAALCVSKGE